MEQASSSWYLVVVPRAKWPLERELAGGIKKIMAALSLDPQLPHSQI
jgi:hypothetical protein